MISKNIIFPYLLLLFCWEQMFFIDGMFSLCNFL